MKNVILGKPVKKLFATFSLLLLGLIFLAWSVEAYIYEEEVPLRQIIVDKQIKTASMTEWQDNLPASQIVLKEGELLEFNIKVKNSGDQELKNIQITDKLPDYWRFIFGPAQPNENREINWQIEKLAAGEEKTFRLRGQIKGLESVKTEGTFCLMNKIRVETETGEIDEDQASFCLLRLKKTPPTGSSNLIWGSLVLGLVALTGIGLRKFGRGEIWA